MNCEGRNGLPTFKEKFLDEEIKRRREILRHFWPSTELIHSLYLQQNESHRLHLLEMLLLKSNSLGISVPSPNINVGESSSILSSLDSALIRIKTQESNYLSQLRVPWRRFMPLVPTSEVILPSINSEYLVINVNNGNEAEILNRKGSRDPKYKFPYRLHQIISNPEYSEYITWLPHGRAWKILKRKQFETIVLPHHFRHGQFSSFLRQVCLCNFYVSSGSLNCDNVASS
jgi:HSF-type DNA-binding